MSQGGSALTYSQIKKSFEFPIPRSLDSTLETRDCLSNLQRCKCQPELNAI